MMTATTHPEADDPHRLRLAAIGLADSNKTRLETDLAACKKTHAVELDKLAKAFTALMPKHEGDLPDDARARLVDLFKADEARRAEEAKKKRAVDKISAKLKKAEAQFWDLIRSKVADRQTALALGDVSLADGLGLSEEVALGVARAIAEVEKAGGKLSPDELRLRARLQETGVVFSLDEEPEEDGEEPERKLGEPAENLRVVEPEATADPDLRVVK